VINYIDSISGEEDIIMEIRESSVWEDIEKFLNEARRMKKEYEQAKVKCGIIGLSGSGKSSLINAIAGEKIAEVGSTEQTMEPQELSDGGIIFVDLPGCGTNKWPQKTYVQDLKLLSYDCFIIVTSTRLYEADLYLYRTLHVNNSKPCFIVRNKIDLAIEDEKRDNDLSEAETLKKIKDNLLSGIKPAPKRVYLTSAREPKKWDLPQLIEDIINSQDGMKRDRFRADSAAYSRQAIREKRLVADKVVSWSAVASAANGLNPIPGIDVSVDVGILVNMVNQIFRIFGMSPEQIQFMEEKFPSPHWEGIKQGIAKLAARYLTSEALILVLKRMSGRVAVKQLSRFLPFVGQLIAAGIGYKMTTALGEQVVNDVEKKACDLFNQMVDQTA
jgi:small GTP-binding protein